MLSNIKCIIFDIGGVLVDLDLERCLESFRSIGFEDARNMVSCYHPASFFGSLERGEISIDEFCSQIRNASGVAMTNEEIIAAYSSLLVGIPVEKLRLMKSLRDRGFRVYALSNISALLMMPIQKFLGADSLSADDYFDKMFLSYQMGVMKPDSKIYEMVIAELDVDPKQMLFIDDSKSNIAAAREFGIQVYLAEAREDFTHLFG
ncbi:MAG: HAD family phosphatase [Rikenellaceae bacterium]